MSNEVNLSSVDFDELNRYYGSSFFQPTSSAENCYEVIFSADRGSLPFTQTAVLLAALSQVEQRIQKVARDNGKEINPMDTGGSGEVKVEIKWGDKDGPSVSVGASGEVHDDNGNYAKGELKQDSNNGGSASVSAGHKEGKEG